MIVDNKELFDTFSGIHDAYVLNPEVNQEKYNHIGNDILEVIREYERKLCGNMNSGSYGAFSQNVSQKFWDEIRKVYRKIDFIGAKIG
jgi:trehalose-6-phosphate synthase